MSTNRMGDAGGGSGGTTTQSVVDQIIAFFRGKGLSDTAIAGILGNWRVESDFSTTAYNPGEGAIGLGQWEHGRREELDAFAAARGLKETDLQAQLEFAWHELTTSYQSVLNGIRNASSPAEAATIWNLHYEVSADRSGKREGYAATYAAHNLQNIQSPSMVPDSSYVGSTFPDAGTSGSAPLTKADMMGTDSLGRLFNSIPALRRLIDKAQANGWDLNRFQNAVENSNWWRTHSDTARASLIQRANDPAAWEQSVGNLMDQIHNLAGQTGLTASRQERRNIAVSALMTGNENNSQWLTEQLSNGTDYSHIHSVAGFTGSMAANIQQLQQMAADYGFQHWSPVSLAREARSIVDGSTTMDTYVQQLRDYAKTAFPSFAQQIDAGKTMTDIAQPYISTAASMLEQNPSNFDVNSPLIKRGLQGTPAKPGDPPSSMPLWAFENQIRQDPRWDRTQNAKSEAAQMLAGIGSAWGYSA